MQSHDYLLSMKISVSIVWFKRDLRVHDHAALSAGNNQRRRAAIGILSMIV
jgi:deoxyribodipyrimidine photolyase